MSKICSNCNAENVEEAKFCRKCGFSFNKQEKTISSKRGEYFNYNEEVKNKSNNFKNSYDYLSKTKEEQELYDILNGVGKKFDYEKQEKNLEKASLLFAILWSLLLMSYIVFRYVVYDGGYTWIAFVALITTLVTQRIDLYTFGILNILVLIKMIPVGDFRDVLNALFLFALASWLFFSGIKNGHYKKLFERLLRKKN